MSCDRISLLEQELEDKKQEVYQMRNKIAVSVSLERDFLCEIEETNAFNMEREAAVKNKIKAEKLALADLDKKLENLEKFEKPIKDLMFKKIELERQIKEADKQRQQKRESAVNLKCDDEEVSKVMLKFVNIQEEIDALTDESTSLQSKEQELDVLIAENKEILSSTQMEVSEKRHELSLLDNKYSALKMAAESIEIELPKLPTQGNSLFAEVHDSEMKLKAALSQLEEYHAKLDLKYSSLVKELGDLCAHIVSLREGIDQIQEPDIDNETTKQLKYKIDRVKAEGEKCKNRVREEFLLFGDTNPDSTTQYFTAVILEAWFEITSTVSSISNFRLEGLAETVKLVKAQQEAREMQRKLVNDEVKLAQLKEKYRKADTLQKPM